MFGNTNLANAYNSKSNFNQLPNNDNQNLMNWIVNMHNVLNRDRINLTDVGALVDSLKHLSDDARDDYLATLLYPESVSGKKIPTLFPIPTSTFQMHLTCGGGTFQKTNNSGNIAWTWNPAFLLENTGTNITPFFLNTDTSLNGNGASNFFLGQDIGYNSLPTGIYGSYRVVSASIVVSYIGRMDIVSGVIGMGIGLNNSGVATPAAINAVDAASGNFSNFLQIDNLYYSERTQAANGTRAIYFPIDDRYTNFNPVYNSTAVGPPSVLANTFVSGFYFAGYAQGLPPATNCLRFDLYINFESIVTSNYNNFIPSSTSNASSINAINEASVITNQKADKIVLGSSDIPGSGPGDVSSAGMISKLASKSNDGYLPSVDVIKKMSYKY